MANKEEEFWDTEEELEEHIHADEDTDKIDVDKLKFTKIKDLEPGMEEVNVEGTIDFIGELWGRGYGEEPHAIGFLRDKTGEVKITFWGEDSRKAKKGLRVKIIQGYTSEYRGQLQLNSNRARGIVFV